MFDVDDFINRAKAAAGVETDYALAVKVLGYKKPSAIYNWRAGLSMPDDNAVLKLCALTGDDPEDVAVRLQSMRAANDDTADLWRRIAERLKQSGSASVAFVVVALSVLYSGAFHLGDAVAATLPGYAYYVECAMAFAALRLLWRVAPWFVRLFPPPLERTAG